MDIKPATRQGIKPLICFYSESGCGKTYSSLLLARGFVGATGKIGMIDSERGRGSLYADVIPGGYDVLQLTDPFSPARYIEAIQAIEAADYAIGVMDSGSHEWEGLGGVLELAGENEARSGKPGLHNWRAPKLEHAKFVLRLMQSRLPWIICLRAKHKTRQAKDERGKTVIVKDDFTTPIQADDFIFEMTAHGEIMQDHGLRLTKCSHPALRSCFPEGTPVTIQHGEALSRWCAGGAKPAATPVDELKAKLWALCKPFRGEVKNWTTAAAQLVAWHILPIDKQISTLTEAELAEVIDKVKIQLSEQA